jgi:hypothetical protein
MSLAISCHRTVPVVRSTALLPRLSAVGCACTHYCHDALPTQRVSGSLVRTGRVGGHCILELLRVNVAV